jgi:hypothetical protein
MPKRPSTEDAEDLARSTRPTSPRAHPEGFSCSEPRASELCCLPTSSVLHKPPDRPLSSGNESGLVSIAPSVVRVHRVWPGRFGLGVEPRIVGRCQRDVQRIILRCNPTGAQRVSGVAGRDRGTQRRRPGPCRVRAPARRRPVGSGGAGGGAALDATFRPPRPTTESWQASSLLPGAVSIRRFRTPWWACARRWSTWSAGCRLIASGRPLRGPTPHSSPPTGEIESVSCWTVKRRLPVIAKYAARQALSARCACHVSWAASLVPYGVSTCGRRIRLVHTF